MKLEDELKKILKLYTDIKVKIDAIDLDENLFAIGMDSLSCMKVIVAIEDTFGFEIGDDDLLLENFQSISSLKQFILSRASK